VAAWDSLATMTLVSVIEEEFGVAVSPEDYESVASFELVKAYIAGKTDNG
jgi:acyl carrier protein